MVLRDAFIWLSVVGGVEGWTVEQLNKQIDRYNNFYYRFSNFWEWLSYEEQKTYFGFSYLFNGNAKIHTIRKMKIEEV